jgi:hypothetical protein
LFKITKDSYLDFFLQDLGFKPKYKKPKPAEVEASRFYGGDDTWHQTGTVDVQLDEDGNVVAVWFRCRTLPFKQSTHIFPAGYGPLQGEGSIKGIVFEGDE